jgi:hypothetical protein
MRSIPEPDEQTYYSSRRQDDVDALAWPVFSQRALDLLRSAGEVLHPEPGELLWDTGDPYDLYLVLAGGDVQRAESAHGAALSARRPRFLASRRCRARTG